MEANMEWSAIAFLRKTAVRENGFTVTFIDAVEEVTLLAERVEELESLIKSHAPEGRNYTNAQYVELLQENRQLYEALEFYADKKTYQLGVSISMGSAFPQHEPIKYDKGEKARQAIEQDEEAE